MIPSIRFTIRALEPADIPKIVAYWTEASPADWERMGIDPSKVPLAEQIDRELQALLEIPDVRKRIHYVIWLVDQVPIGFSSLKNIRYGESGEMHLHMWDAASRGKGYGSVLFCRSVLEFYRRFKLKSLKCQPRAANPLPNRVLHKIGFPLVRTHTAAPSDLSLVCEINEYDIRFEIADRYLSL